MKYEQEKSNIELSLSSISWQLKRIADSLEVITDELSSDDLLPKNNTIQSSKLSELIKQLK